MVIYRWFTNVAVRLRVLCESKSFTFYSSYVAGASRASIELLFDENLIFKYLAAKDWTGNECEEYFKNHPDTVREY